MVRSLENQQLSSRKALFQRKQYIVIFNQSSGNLNGKDYINENIHPPVRRRQIFFRFNPKQKDKIHNKIQLRRNDAHILQIPLKDEADGKSVIGDRQ